VIDSNTVNCFFISVLKQRPAWQDSSSAL